MSSSCNAIGIRAYPYTALLDYAANSTTEKTHCIGAATSTDPIGPFQPTSEPIICPPKEEGGVIDPAGFQDTDGTYWVTYKVDGNSRGGPGPCGNLNGEFPTPIMLQQMESDAITPTGSPIQILDRTAADGPLVEAPDIVLGTFFSPLRLARADTLLSRAVDGVYASFQCMC